jgi:hypothetical protein
MLRRHARVVLLVVLESALLFLERKRAVLPVAGQYLLPYFIPSTYSVVLLNEKRQPENGMLS